jgi:hypothetical protein
MVGSVAAAARTAGAGTAAAESHKLLLDRIAAAEAAIVAGSGNGNVGFTNTTTRQDTSSTDAGAGVTGAGRNPAGTDTGASQRPATALNTTRVTVSPTGKKTSTGPASTDSSQAEEPDEPPLTRPMTPDEQRGFPPPTDPPEWQK